MRAINLQPVACAGCAQGPGLLSERRKGTYPFAPLAQFPRQRYDRLPAAGMRSFDIALVHRFLAPVLL
jgi:hypothetical protein